MFDAFILAAGFGTRLRPLTHHRPKPLLPVCGVPMLAYTLALCHRHGLRDVVVNAHHLADQLRPWEGLHEGVRGRACTRASGSCCRSRSPRSWAPLGA
ncbi:MAG: NTP transferase domain-containing protein [Deltaproteobacteria bacterium]|nr:NTP transferase domain-containing protein [Deltaproteobacteria bacterium]